MGQAYQKTITLSAKDIPEALKKYAEKQDRSVSNVTKLCIWLVFGDTLQQQKAKEILGTWTP